MAYPELTQPNIEPSPKGLKPRYAQMIFEFSEPTLDALGKFAQFTGRGEGDEGLAGILTDEGRTYEWILSQQANGRVIIALEEADIALLEASDKVAGSREALEKYIQPDQLEEAKAYFSEQQRNSQWHNDAQDVRDLSCSFPTREEIEQSLRVGEEQLMKDIQERERNRPPENPQGN